MQALLDKSALFYVINFSLKQLTSFKTAIPEFIVAPPGSMTVIDIFKQVGVEF